MSCFFLVLEAVILHYVGESDEAAANVWDFNNVVNEFELQLDFFNLYFKANPHGKDMDVFTPTDMD